MFNWKKEVRTQLKENFGDDVKIKFKGDDPTLVFKDGTSDKFKRAVIAFVTILWKEMGGEVKFHPERAVHTAG